MLKRWRRIRESEEEEEGTKKTEPRRRDASKTHPRNDFQILRPRPPILHVHMAPILLPEVMFLLGMNPLRIVHPFLLLIDLSNLRNREALPLPILLRVVSLNVLDLLPDIVLDDLAC